jgi:hypothetical protein
MVMLFRGEGPGSKCDLSRFSFQLPIGGIAKAVDAIRIAIAISLAGFDIVFPLHDSFAVEKSIRRGS